MKTITKILGLASLLGALSGGCGKAYHEEQYTRVYFDEGRGVRYDQRLCTNADDNYRVIVNDFLIDETVDEVTIKNREGIARLYVNKETESLFPEQARARAKLVDPSRIERVDSKTIAEIADAAYRECKK